jgi:hypothetical protein
MGKGNNLRSLLFVLFFELRQPRNPRYYGHIITDPINEEGCRREEEKGDKKKDAFMEPKLPELTGFISETDDVNLLRKQIELSTWQYWNFFYTHQNRIL